MNRLDKQYLDLCQELLDKGNRKVGRNGATISIFGKQIRHKMSDGFPLLTTKKMHFKGIVTELLWFLNGRTDLKYLLDHDIHIWDGDAYRNYTNTCDEDKWMKEIILNLSFPNKSYSLLSQEEFINKIKTDDEFAKKWGDLGPIYGHNWRTWVNRIEVPAYGGTFSPSTEWVNRPIDQLSDLIKKLKTTPDDRRMMVTAWNPSEIEAAVLPPCHYGFQVYTRELSEQERWWLYCETCNQLQTPSIKGSTDRETMDRYYTEYNIPTRTISLLWNQRSVDTPLGLPYNIASYGLLLIILGKIVNMVPEELIGNLGDTHIYENQIEKLKEQFGEELSDAQRGDIYVLKTGANRDELMKSTNDKYDWDILFDDQNIPTRSREPFPLPTVVLGKTDAFFKSLREDLSLLHHLEPSDFILQNYQSHPAINIPLSN